MFITNSAAAWGRSRFAVSLVFLAAAVLGSEFIYAADHSLAQAVSNPGRSVDNVRRDIYRNPQQTLEFFGVTPESRVVEIWPGRGWYTEILAPYLSGKGQLYAAHFPEQTEIAYFRRGRTGFVAKVTGNPQLFGGMKITEFHPPSKVAMAPAASADFVLTFRNVHNWMKAGYARAAFAEFYKTLTPGGILGVVEHRAKPGTDLETMIKSGYVTEDHVIELATAAGFKLVDSSEVNANPKDSADHPAGVWTLPPSLRLKDQNRDAYLAIGESDRMTLKFIKPAQP